MDALVDGRPCGTRFQRVLGCPDLLSKPGNLQLFRTTAVDWPPGLADVVVWSSASPRLQRSVAPYPDAQRLVRLSSPPRSAPTCFRGTFRGPSGHCAALRREGAWSASRYSAVRGALGLRRPGELLTDPKGPARLMGFGRIRRPSPYLPTTGAVRRPFRRGRRAADPVDIAARAARAHALDRHRSTCGRPRSWDRCPYLVTSPQPGFRTSLRGGPCSLGRTL